eukprot:TRINITY_DN4886_c0_g2_i1.p1 TRINITY_DN4886_c0_g2~~TRINITY_DN4886_c0_g2_i1.p1  ORF type:complete len:1360 (-),score=311.48 TRINITY_DN4886_c0_g2_i1:10-3831(-)
MEMDEENVLKTMMMIKMVTKREREDLESVLGLQSDNAEDCAILKALHDATNGGEWFDRAGWDQVSTHCCSAFGITCSNGRVTVVDLNYNNLTGIIPEEIGNIKYLIQLELRNNNLHGGIPSSLNIPMHLMLVDFSVNSLNGSIPLSITNAPSLSYLLLDQNELSGEIPKEIGRLKKMKFFSAGSNQFNGNLPREIGNCTALEVLNLQFNQISGHIPSELFTIESLSLIRLSANQLEGTISSQIGMMKNLQTLSLSGNLFNGTIPTEISFLHKLEKLDLNSNMLIGGIPKEIGMLRNITLLNLSQNALSGNIPPELGNLTNLQYLWLDANELDGPLPKELSQLKKLIELKVNDNEFSGELPTELLTLPSLCIFDVQSNKLDGRIPPEIGNMTNVTSLLLRGNQFIGEIPSTIGNLRNLSKLSLSATQLAGKIPPEIGMLSSLVFLDLSLNFLEGEIPAELSNLKELMTLSLADNNLSGVIPSCFSNLTNLVTINVGINSLEGDIEWICDLERLEELVIQHNKFTHLCYSKPPKFKYVYGIGAAGNELVQFPWSSIPYSRNLVSLDLSHNNLSGDFPRELFDPQCSVALLDLSYNRFEGFFPVDPCTSMGENLNFLSLAGNTITGFYFIDRNVENVKTCTLCRVRQWSLGFLDLSYTIQKPFFRDEIPIALFGVPCIVNRETPLQLIWRLGGLQVLHLQGWPLKDFIEDIIRLLPYLDTIDIRDTFFRRNQGSQTAHTTVVMNPNNPIPQDSTYDCYRSISSDGAVEVLVDPFFWSYENCFCRDGYWGKPPNCKQCLDHGVCESPSSAGVDPEKMYDMSGIMYAEDGFWGTPHASSHEISLGLAYPEKFIACTGIGTSESPCISSSQRECRVGYYDRKCSKCDQNYFSVSNRCFKCPSSAWLVVFALLIALCVAMVVVFAFLRGQSSGVGMLKILVFFVQGLSYISVPMPNYLYMASSSGSFIFGLNIAGWECYFKDWSDVHAYIFHVSQPFLVSVLLFLIWGIGVLWKRTRGRGSESKAFIDGVQLPVSWGQQCMSAWIFLQFLLYMSVCTEILKPIACEKDDGDGKWYMKNIPYAKCSDAMRGVSFFLIIVYIVGLPAAALYMILNRLDRYRFVLDILVGSFGKLRFWEVLVAFRRVIFVSAFLSLPEYSAFLAIWIELVLGVSLLLQGMLHPFKTVMENAMELSTLIALTVNHVVAVELHNDYLEQSNGAILLLFIINSMLIAYLLFEVIRRGKFWGKLQKFVRSKHYGVDLEEEMHAESNLEDHLLTEKEE